MLANLVARENQKQSPCDRVLTCSFRGRAVGGNIGEAFTIPSVSSVYRPATRDWRVSDEVFQAEA
jgi:hypothetical protein